MPACKSVYEPREDSTILEKYVRQYAKGSVLDMGTGSGIQAIAAAHNDKVSSVLALDIQKETIDHCKKNIKNRKIKFMVSDLFEIFENKKPIRKFDTIIFNPPYLPSELKLRDLTIESGKKGYEIIERFLNGVNNFLKTNGLTLIVFSSLTKKEKIDEFTERNLLEFKLLEKQHYFFEDLYVYLLEKSSILKKLEKRNIEDIKYFKKGKRGLIFTGLYKRKRIAIKTENPKSKAVARVENEIKFLKILNKKNIGPKLLFSDNTYLVYEFIDGVEFPDFISRKKTTKKQINNIINRILEQLFVLDKLRVNKEEMSHPQKHILIKKDKPFLIDFERARFSRKPSNISQFCTYLMSNNIKKALLKKGIEPKNEKVIGLLKNYKKRLDSASFSKIKKEIQ